MNWGKRIMYIVLILAVIGIIGQLIMSPGQFFRSILMMIGMAVLIGLLLYFLLIRRRQPVDKGYRKALKQSKRKYGSTKPRPVNIQTKQGKQPSRLRRGMNKQPQLRVIKGNKKI